jgi:ribonuclease HII
MQRESLEILRVKAASGPPWDGAFLEALASDGRKGARQLYRRCCAALEASEKESARIDRMLTEERKAASSGFTCVAGVDEAGRGPLAGPIVAAAVTLSAPVNGLNDSKQLKEREREELFTVLECGGHGIGVAVIPASDIDAMGIQQANYLVMLRAVGALSPPPDFVLVDGFRVPGLTLPQARLVKGDSRSLSIAAASIIAKVTRDRILYELDREYPVYGFGSHKGYATRAHLDAVARHGPCPAHRQSFAPLSNRREDTMLF